MRAFSVSVEFAGEGLGPHSGPYRADGFVLQFPPLNPDAIETGLATALVGRQIKVWKRLASTNDLAVRAAASRENEGLVILAEEQTAGRGRLGRRWAAEPGSGILMSLLLFPPEHMAQPEALVCLSAVGVAEALQEFVSQPVEIKWPNDLYLGGRKLGGILVERQVGTVIGIGINVHMRPAPDAAIPAAVCLADDARVPLDRSQIVRRLLQVLDARYAEACRDGIGAIVTAWRQRAAFVGDSVEVEVRGVLRSGTLLEIDPLTSLTLRSEHGQIERFPLHDVQGLRSLGR